ncbi:hypothetical protein LXA43DRAFT_1159872 [Ganoderma leucocontextum]|nr:hypothetical protein LXA43DRAFT_1159872 [Ganoderma leucocontextum]
MPRSAAHSVLFCQEILLEILAHLSPGWFPWDYSDRDRYPSQDLKHRRLLQQTLASCARTCRAFSDLALAELWRVLDHHVLLLKLLPWRTNDDGLFEEVLRLEPEIDGQVWSRFRWYARLVREMKGYVYTDQIDVHRNTWTLLASRLREEPLLPSLRRLQMPANVEDIVPFLFFLSPTVRAFTLEFELGSRVAVQDRDFLHPFLALISEPSRHPQDLPVRHLLGRKGDTEEVMQHLRKCTRLRMLEELDLSKVAYSIDSSSIAALSRLPSLHTLSTGLWVRVPPITPSFTFTGFASLRNLSLRLLPLPTLSDILATSGLRTSTLRSIHLASSACTTDETPSPIPISEFQRHLSLIRTALPDDLESFRLCLIYSTRTEPPHPLSALFAPFFTLGRLKTFDVSFRRGYVPHVADEDLRALAAAWPHLEVLSIWVWEMRAPTFSAARPPTVAGLVELARGCPRLRRVTLPALDVSVLPEVSTHPRDGHSGVRFLDVNALVGDGGVAVEEVASLLDRLFPLHEEYSRVGAGTPQAKYWSAVQDAMRDIQAARKVL